MWSWSPMSFFRSKRRRVVEELAGLPQEEGLGVHAGLLALGQFGEHGGLGGLQHAIETAEDGERQDDLAVFGLLVVAAQEIGDGPDEGGEIGVGHAGWLLARGTGRAVAWRRVPGLTEAAVFTAISVYLSVGRAGGPPRKGRTRRPADSISSPPRSYRGREPKGIAYHRGRDLATKPTADQRRRFRSRTASGTMRDMIGITIFALIGRGNGPAWFSAVTLLVFLALLAYVMWWRDR